MCERLCFSCSWLLPWNEVCIFFFFSQQSSSTKPCHLTLLLLKHVTLSLNQHMSIPLLGNFLFVKCLFPFLFTISFPISFFQIVLPIPFPQQTCLIKNNFGKEALGCKEGILSHGSNGKKTLIITPHWWMRSEKSPIKNNEVVQLRI